MTRCTIQTYNNNILLMLMHDSLIPSAAASDLGTRVPQPVARIGVCILIFVWVRSRAAVHPRATTRVEVPRPVARICGCVPQPLSTRAPQDDRLNQNAEPEHATYINHTSQLAQSKCHLFHWFDDLFYFYFITAPPLCCCSCPRQASPPPALCTIVASVIESVTTSKYAQVHGMIASK